MPDTAEILAQPTIAQAIRELVIRAMSDAGIGQAHCIRAAIGLTDRIATGEPVAEAVALIDDIASALSLETASLKRQVIDSALRAERLEADRTEIQRVIDYAFLNTDDRMRGSDALHSIRTILAKSERLAPHPAEPTGATSEPQCEARSPIDSRCVLREKHWSEKGTLHTDGEHYWRSEPSSSLPSPSRPFASGAASERARA